MSIIEILVGGSIGFCLVVGLGSLIIWFKYKRKKLGYLTNIDDDELYR